MAKQLVLDLPFRVAMGRADFFVSEANMAAVAGIDGWRDWPLSKMILVGPEASGKTHLAHVWATQAGATMVRSDTLSDAELPTLTEAPALAIEDVERVAGDRAAETRLFHLHNALGQRGAPLLLTGRSAPGHWGIGLPDLASRIAQSGLLTLHPPDDRLLGAVMVKLAQDRQLKLTPAVVSYAINRVERSFGALRSLVAELDERAMIEGKVATTAHVKSILSGDT